MVTNISALNAVAAASMVGPTDTTSPSGLGSSVPSIKFPSDIDDGSISSAVRIRAFDYTTPFDNSAAVLDNTEGIPVTDNNVNPNDAKYEIILPAPLQIQSNYNFTFETPGMNRMATIGEAFTAVGGLDTDAMGQVIQTVGRGLASAVTPNLERLIALNTGTAINPLTVMLFQGPTHRQFSLNFIMSPKSEEDANAMVSIIDQLKLSAHPSVGDFAAAGAGAAEQNAEASRRALMFNYPDYFLLEFLYRDEGDDEWKGNNMMYKTGRTFCESIGVNFHNAGTQSYFKKDGIPVNVALSLQFKEFQVITKEHIFNNELGMNNIQGGI